MEVFVVGLEAFQNLNGFVHAGLDKVDALEASGKRAILLEVVAVFLEGGGADAAHLARGQERLEDVGGVHAAAGHGASAHDGVDFVDKKDGSRLALEFGKHALEPGFKVAAVLGAGKKGAHVQGEDLGLGELGGDASLGDEQGQALGECGLAHPRFPHKNGIVLAAAGQHLDHAFQFGRAADDGIDLPIAGLGRQIAGELLKGAFALRSVLMPGRTLKGVIPRAEALVPLGLHAVGIAQPCEMYSARPGAWTPGK
jgi:hypothetical protein